MHHKLVTLITRKSPVHFVVPSTLIPITIYPTQIEIEGKKITLVQGLVTKFQVFLDLKRGFIEVKGSSQDKFFNYEIRAQEGKIQLIGKKGISSKTLFKTKTKAPESLEFLHFGVHKKQQIEKIFERGDIKEFVPIWYQLGQFFPKVKEQKIALFDQLEKLKKQKKHNLIGDELVKLFYFLFPHQFVPVSTDVLKIGYEWKIPKGKNATFSFLQQAREYIRSLFIEEKKGKILILPHLIPEFVFGRFEDVQTSYGKVSIRFSKKKPFSLEFYPNTTGTLSLVFPSAIKTCRFKENKKQRGERFKLPLKMSFEKEKTYLLDRFEK